MAVAKARVQAAGMIQPVARARRFDERFIADRDDPDFAAVVREAARAAAKSESKKEKAWLFGRRLQERFLR